VAFSGSGAGVSQCVSVQPNTRYYFGVKYRQQEPGHVFCSMVFYSAANCTGNSVGGTSILPGDAANVWAVLKSFLDSPANAASAAFTCADWGGFVELDQLFLSTSDGY
jgi:hypothetical protein